MSDLSKDERLMLVQLGAGSQALEDDADRAVADKLAKRGLVRATSIVRVELNEQGHEAREAIEQEERKS